MRTIADAFDDFFNKTGTGIKDLIDSKLDKTGKAADSAKADYATSAGSATTASNAANAAHADTADTATSAGKATNDGNGNNIAQTYAKLSDIPSSVDAYSKAESDAKFLAISGKETINNIEYFKVNSNVSFAQLTDFATSGVIFLRDTEIRAIDGSNWGSFKFKSDGIYMNGTKITN